MKFIFQYKHTKAKISLKTNIKSKICSSMSFSGRIAFYIDSLNQLITTKIQKFNIIINVLWILYFFHITLFLLKNYILFRLNHGYKNIIKTWTFLQLLLVWSLEVYRDSTKFNFFVVKITSWSCFDIKTTHPLGECNKEDVSI